MFLRQFPIKKEIIIDKIIMPRAIYLQAASPWKAQFLLKNKTHKTS